MLLQRHIFQGAKSKAYPFTSFFYAHTLPATVLTLGNAETQMYNIITSETFDLCFTLLDTILANYIKNCIHYVQAEWNLSIEQICSKMVVLEP
jgi:hypothetical protein